MPAYDLDLDYEGLAVRAWAASGAVGLSLPACEGGVGRSVFNLADKVASWVDNGELGYGASASAGASALFRGGA
jgi:hypothetical protein